MRKPSKAGILEYFHCADCEILSESAKKNGGQVFEAKWSIGKDGYVAINGDTEANAIGLRSFK